MNKTRDEIDREILWYESLKESIEDGLLDEAIGGIDAAIDLLKRQRREAK